MQQHNNWCVYVRSVWRGTPDCSPAYPSKQEDVASVTSSSQRTHLATRLSGITTATTGQKTIGSETQSDLLMMGVKTPETC